MYPRRSGESAENQERRYNIDTNIIVIWCFMVLYFIYYNILLYYAFVSRGLKGLWFFKSGDTQKNSHAEVRVNYTVPRISASLLRDSA